MRRVAAQSHKVPFLRPEWIEAEAQLLLDEWAERHPAVIEPPVPIEEILEGHLRLMCSICDLQSELGSPDVLGGIWFGKREIKIDQSLDPTTHRRMLGRYRFTIAHEVGHWRLHRQHLMNDPSAASLFEADCEPAFVQRSSQNPSEEVQANAFAALVLMPLQLVLDAWSQWRGSDDPVAITDLAVGSYHESQKANEEMAIDQFCKPLADQFEVSSQAMRYRLQQLQLVVKGDQARLF